MKGYSIIELVSDLRGRTHTHTVADATGHVQDSNGHMPLERVLFQRHISMHPYGMAGNSVAALQTQKEKLLYFV